VRVKARDLRGKKREELEQQLDTLKQVNFDGNMTKMTLL